MVQSEVTTVTANFYFPGTNVVAELITKENPMTPYRKRKIQAMRASGYKVLVWNENDFQTMEGTEQKMRELYQELGIEPDKEQLEKYKDRREQLHRELLENV